LALPYFLFKIKQYQHGNYRLGQLRAELRTSGAKTYEALFTVFGVWIALLIGVIAAVFLTFTMGLMILAPFVAVAGYLLLLVFPWAYGSAKLQNLFWSRTGNRFMRFRSELLPAGYTALVAKNLLLTVLTVGLYRPFAAVSQWRARMEAVSLVSRVDFEQLSQVLASGQTDAAGEMGADLLGLDLGW
jgi:uncharacterized membrane protein YjgN (DUF898 family)